MIGVGYMAWPLVGSVQSGRFTLSHGISPSVATLEVPPGGIIPPRGNLEIGINGHPVVVMYDCVIDRITERYSGNSRVWQLSILDRRWKWKYGYISGTYNYRDRANNLQRQVSAQGLAALLLGAMGELVYDIGGLPTDSYPPVEWSADNPSRELARLAEMFGCRVILGVDNIVRVVKAGVGGPLILSGNPVLSSAPGNVNIAHPDSIAVVPGVSLFQLTMQLEAVGEELGSEGGGIWPIDALSYAPGNKNNPAGVRWDPPLFASLSDVPDATGMSPRQLARKSVFRWYQITDKLPDGSTLLYPLPDGSYWSSLAQDVTYLIGLQDRMVDAYANSDAEETALPPTIFGSFSSTTQAAPGNNGNTVPTTQYLGSYSLDPAPGRALVQFADPVTAMTGVNNGPALLNLTCACTLRNPTTWEWIRAGGSAYTFAPENQGGTGPEILRHDEMVYHSTPLFNFSFNAAGFTSWQISGIASDNYASLQSEAAYYLNGALQPYLNTSSLVVEYAGIMFIQPDGAIQQITWSVEAGKPPTTRACDNLEADPTVPPYRQRRAFEELHEIRKGALKVMLNRLGANGAPLVVPPGVMGS